VFVTVEQATIINTTIIGVETSQWRNATPWSITRTSLDAAMMRYPAHLFPYAVKM
jgi:hypothetical protein